MSDDLLKGLGSDEELRQDKDIEGVSDLSGITYEDTLEGIQQRAEDSEDALEQAFSGPLPQAPSIDPTQVVLEQQLARLTQISELQSVLIQQQVQLDRQRISIISAQTTNTGEDEAAELTMGPFRKDFEIYYDITSGTGNIIIEVSLDGSSWKEYESVSIPAAGDEDVAQGETTYPYVRVYPDKNLDETDVTKVEIVAKGG